MADDVQPDPDQAWKALSLVNEWVRHAETKIVATLAAAGLSGGLLYNVAKGWPEPSVLAVVLGYLAAVALVSAGWACAMGLVPRRTAGVNDRGLIDILGSWKSTISDGRTARGGVETREGEVAAPPDDLVNLLFYSHIVKAYGEAGPEYREVLAALTRDPKAMTEHVAQQTWANATVAERKYNWANRALVRLLISWLLLAALAYTRVIGW